MSRAFEAIVLSVCDRCALSVVERGACRDRCVGIEYACCTARRRAVRINANTNIDADAAAVTGADVDPDVDAGAVLKAVEVCAGDMTV